MTYQDNKCYMNRRNSNSHLATLHDPPWRTQNVFKILAYKLTCSPEMVENLVKEISYNVKVLKGKIVNYIPDGSRRPLPQALLDNVHANFYIQLISNLLGLFKVEKCIEIIGAILLIAEKTHHSQENVTLCNDLVRTFGSESWLSEAAKLCNCSRLAFTIGLGKALGFHPESCFYPVPSQSGSFSVCEIEIMGDFKEFSVGSTIYRQTGSFNFLDFSGAIIHTVLRYSSNTKNIFVFACRISTSTDNLIIGVKYPSPLLYRHADIINTSGATLFLALNPDVLASLLLFADEITPQEDYFPIVTGVFGGNEGIKAMNITPVYGHKVIILCCPDCAEYEKLNTIAKLCTNNGAEDVQVYPYPIVGDYCWTSFEKLPPQDISSSSPKQIDIRKWECGNKFFEKVENDAIPIKNLKKWEVEIGLHDKSDEEKKSKQSNFLCKSWTNIPIQPNKDNLSLRDFLSPDSTTLIYGYSGVAKSWLALGFAVHAAAGKEFMGFKASKPMIVIYIDGELGTQISSRIKQLSSGFSKDEKEQLKNNLLVITPDKAGEFLYNKEIIIEFIKEKNIKIFIIDNLIALYPNAYRGNNDEFKDMIKSLKSIGVAPVIVHHTGKDKKEYLGSGSLGSLSQNILKIQDVRDVDYVNRELNSAVEKFKDDKGPLIEVTLEKTKVAPYWNKESIFLHLPINGDWMQLTGWPELPDAPIPIDNLNPNLESVNLSEEKLSRIANLPPDKREIMIFLIKNPGGAKRAEIDSALKWKKNKSLKILNSLADTGYVKLEERGKATYYKSTL